MSILGAALGEIPDVRGRSGRIFRLDSMILLTVTAFLNGADSLAGIYRFGQRLGREHRLALGFMWHRMPSHATLCLFFQSLDVQALERVLGRIVLGTSDKQGRVHLALDGKTLRGSTSEERPNGLHLLSFFADSFKAVVAQRAGKRGYNEVTTAIEMLREMPLDGAIITGDAMFAARTFCRMVRAQGGEYMLPVKGNQPGLQRAIKTAMDDKKTA